ncbi:Cof-type HAD-IIB family hydrolase [Limosilactobacillus reuteri]|uniref:Cof-type HAD-IIB family hydrolase n=1 Tax=Limosilactobacillus reuteri TaxID=1598 RepID=A0A317GIH6_LIMRT|nr:Cof-type HAD-IIB family hydrolase [Limosilactobacillus reuteri]MCH5385049.1 Cof-type HAD-IIB family hydrolase [Limosilactobacillus reuteri]PWT48253.1 Cof-type HAD-IIB family hydrolase [Limosilactobacillus reuteri]PWT52218.1 Cof-type HAD-IIB family hydrolase [Limosilactobacillus reuteri]PWT62940.1 Cof-type HAD-IIB family hydrolase [Limosilactobacillus reuteri]
MIKMVALDLDNTLLNSNKEISQRNERVLKQLHQQGIKVVLCTGRPINAIWPYIEQLGLTDPEDYTITFNGGLVINNESREHLFELGMKKSDLLPLFSYVKSKKIPLNILDFERVYELNDYPGSIYRTVLKNIEFQALPMSDVPEITYSKAVMAITPEKLSPIIKELPAELKAHYHAVQSQPMIMEFLPKKLNKAVGLKALLDHFSDDFSNLMTFGDADNDLEMIKAAAQGIVMENGLPNVKAVATAITDTNDNDGVARYCERYFATLL